MEALAGILGFYLVVAAVIEAALKGLERVFRGTWDIFYKGAAPEVAWTKIWSPTCKWLMVILSIGIVWKIGVFFIQILAVNVLSMSEGFSIGIWDPILTGLLISRGSNVIHEFIEKLKLSNREG